MKTVLSDADLAVFGITRQMANRSEQASEQVSAQRKAALEQMRLQDAEALPGQTERVLRQFLESRSAENIARLQAAMPPVPDQLWLDDPASVAAIDPEAGP